MIAPKGYNQCIQGLHGIDIITPGTSTVDHVQDNNYCEFARLQRVLNTAPINAFYVWTVFPPNTRFRIGLS